MTKRKIKKLKAYNYDTFPKARARGYTLKQWQNSHRAIKAWNNLSTLEQELRVEKLQQGKKRQLKEQKRAEEEMLVDAYEIVSQSHYDYRKKGVNSRFEYNTKGLFQFEPSIEKIEKMVKNSLMGAFNNGAKKKGYLKNSLFTHLTDTNLKGVKVNKIKVSRSQINNRLDAELDIFNNGNKWTGRN